MSSQGPGRRLTILLDSLPFVETVATHETNLGVRVLCRVKKGAEAKWAAVVEKVLREAQNTSGLWESHICRLYFLHNDSMVYGWNFQIISEHIDDSLDRIAYLLFPQEKPTPKKKTQPSESPQPASYSPPLQADEKGNPLVKRYVEEIPFAGMEGVKDRNAPKAGSTKGAYKAETVPIKRQ